MRIIDDAGNPVDNPDLQNGYLINATIIKDDAIPIDDVEKFAWADDDWEDVQIYRTFDNAQRIGQAKGRLEETDYIAAKAMDKLMACTSVVDILTALNDMATEYKDIIIEREQLRKMINDLETKE